MALIAIHQFILTHFVNYFDLSPKDLTYIYDKQCFEVENGNKIKRIGDSEWKSIYNNNCIIHINNNNNNNNNFSYVIWTLKIENSQSNNIECGIYKNEFPINVNN